MNSHTASVCPVTGARIDGGELEKYDPLDLAQALDPEPWMSVARSVKPIFYAETVGRWIVTRESDVSSILRDPAGFSSDEAVTISPLVLEQMPDGYPLADAIAAVDPPRHTYMRKMAARFFTVRQSESLAPLVSELADELIDRFIDRGHADLAPEFCQRIPIQVVGALLEIESAAAQDLYDWAVDGLMLQSQPNLSDPDRIAQVVRTQENLYSFIQELIDDRRGTPERTDLITTLVQAREDDGTPTLTSREIVGIVGNVLTAGADTAATTMANCLVALLSERHLWERVVADPGLIPRALEETLRHRPPFRMLPRTATERVTVGGVTFEPGDRLLLHVHSAHHDDQSFPEAGEFRLDRKNPKDHLGFGKGIHYCLGAPIARIEMRVALERLAARLPDLRLVDEAAARYSPGLVIMPIRDGLNTTWGVSSTVAEGDRR